jgi:hypothetical protein
MAPPHIKGEERIQQDNTWADQETVRSSTNSPQAQ